MREYFILFLVVLGFYWGVGASGSKSISGVNPPRWGVWNVTQPTIVENEVLMINGSINITSQLTLRNSILIMSNFSAETTDDIYVHGKLVLENSTIKSSSASYLYEIYAYEGSIIELSSSKIQNCYELETYGSVFNSSNNNTLYVKYLSFYDESSVKFGSNTEINTYKVEIVDSNLDAKNCDIINDDEIVFNNITGHIYHIHIDTNELTMVSSPCINIESSQVDINLDIYISGANVTISSTTVSANNLIFYGDNLTIKNCDLTFRYYAYGMYLDDTSLITGSTITSEGSPTAIRIADDDVKIRNNRIHGSVDIYRDCANVVIESNTIIARRQHIAMKIYDVDVQNILISENSIYNGSILVLEDDLVDMAEYTVSGNTINDLSVLWWVSENLKTIKDVNYGELILVGCRNITIRNVSTYGINIVSCGNITMEKIVSSGGYAGLYVDGDIGGAIIVRNSTFIHNYYGAYLHYSCPINITYSAFVLNEYHGIYDSSTPLTVHNSTFSLNRDVGLYCASININATYNWWGSELGPELTATGDPYDPEELYSSSYIAYSPYLSEPVVSPDTQEPTLISTSPANHSFVSGTFIISVNATDNTEIDRVEIYVDSNIIAILRTPPYQTQYTPEIEKEYTITINIYDIFGNLKSVKIYVIYNLPPTINIISPTAVYLRGIVQIIVNATDSSGLSWVAVYLNGSLLDNMTAAPYIFTWNTSKYDDGYYLIRAIACDSFGLTAEDMLGVYVDNAPPIIYSVNVSQEGNIVVVRVNASDNLSGVSKVVVYYSTDGEIWNHVNASLENNLWVARIAIPSENNVTVSLRIVVTDYAGNIAEEMISYTIVRQKEEKFNWLLIALIIVVIVIIAIIVLKRFGFGKG